MASVSMSPLNSNSTVISVSLFRSGWCQGIVTPAIPDTVTASRMSKIDRAKADRLSVSVTTASMNRWLGQRRRGRGGEYFRAAIGDIPDFPLADQSISAPGNNGVFIGTKSHRRHRRSMPQQRFNSSRVGIPQTYAPVYICAGEHVSLRAESNVQYRLFMVERGFLSPVLGFHSRTVPSILALARRLVAGLKATLKTLPVCPLSVA